MFLFFIFFTKSITSYIFLFEGVTVFGYKYNEEKTLKWLEGKVNRTCAALIQQSVRVSSDSAVVSNNFVKNSSESTEHKGIKTFFVLTTLNLISL